jgi:hypothetical protein
MDEKEANIVGLLNMMTRIAQQVLPEALPEVDSSALAEEMRKHLAEHREVQAKQVGIIAERFSGREVETISEWAESPMGQRVLEAIPLVSYYPFREAVERLVQGFMARINELEERIQELEG